MRNHLIIRSAICTLAVLVSLAAGANTISAADSLTRAESRFINQMNDQVVTMTDTMNDMTDLFNDASDDISLVSDRDWNADVADIFETIRDTHDEAKRLKPSDRQYHLYVYWIEATGLASSATELMETGIEDLDAESLTDGADMLRVATDVSEELSDAITDFGEDPDALVRKADRIDSPVSDCDEFSNYEVAQVYFALNPRDEETLDPNEDGRACEEEFDRDFELPE